MFMRTTKNGKTILKTPLGDFEVESEAEATLKSNEIFDEMTHRLKREPTKAELISGPVAADDRTPAQKMEFDAWKPKRPESPKLLKMADELDGGESKPDYTGMTRNQRLAADMRAAHAREVEEADKAAQHAEKLRRLKPDLKKIDDAIEAENWRAENGSRRIVDLLYMTRSQLVDGSDAAETRRLRSEVQTLITERAKVEQAHNLKAIAELEAQIASIRDGSHLGNLGETDPVKYRAEQLMAEGRDPTGAWTQARAEAAEQGESVD
ncbi:hypothetical protein NG895_04150 [Aeoliella sp. ICT_H6.2]|uniref:Uncharacterized protein n=1 Tax=Aeoliella straminimaris TaxID=2954799 RepID=A0A9X2F7I9_9BACT|nr:hypothetical protein [Aeoliella straminimaris]MCO6043088.1 hypothetical protein [Aeoliella straminimaris]